MKMMKKSLALLLVLSMVLSYAPMPALAEEAAETTAAAVETVPAETTAETVPAETTAATVPAETAAETVPAETTAETVPAETTAETVPAETTAETVPTETTTETVPEETTIVELAPVRVANPVAGAVASAPQTRVAMPNFEIRTVINKGTWSLNAENTGAELYDAIIDELRYGYLQNAIYIRTSQGKGDAIPLSECKSHTFTDGTYYIYAAVRGEDGIPFFQEWRVILEFRYRVNISMKDPTGQGGITVNGNNAGSYQLVKPGENLTLTVNPVQSYKVKIDTDYNYSSSGNSHTFHSVNKNFSFHVVYEPSEFMTVNVTNSTGATIKVDGKTTSTVQVVAQWPYKVEVNADVGYLIDTVKIGSATYSVNGTSWSMELTAGANGTSQNVSVTMRERTLNVRDSVTIGHSKSIDNDSAAKTVFNAIYTGTGYSADDIGTSVWVDRVDPKETGFTGGLMFDAISPLNCDFPQSVQIRLRDGRGTSDVCTVYLYDKTISAPGGKVVKEYTGSPIELTTADFTWSDAGNYQSVAAESVSYYDASGKLLNGAPTEAGSYQVRVRSLATREQDFGYGYIFRTEYRSWSRYISYEIKEPPKFDVTASVEGGTVTGAGEHRRGDTVTLTFTPDVTPGHALKSLTANGVDVLNQAVNNVYTFTMPGEAVEVKAVFAVCDHTGSAHTTASNDSTDKHGFTCTQCGLKATELHAPGENGGNCICGFHPIINTSIDGSAGWIWGEVEIQTVRYSLTANHKTSPVTCQWSDGSTGETYDPAALNAGTHVITCTLTVDGYRKTIEKNVTVSKAEPVYTEPGKVTGLIYDGQAKSLITGGSVTEGGVMQYYVGDTAPTDDAQWLSDAPTGVKSGNYNVHWRVKGDQNHNDAAGTLTVTIAKKPVTATVTAMNKDYDGTTEANVIAEVKEGLIEGDSISIIDVTGTFSDANAGENKTVAINDEAAQVTGTNADCYEIRYPATTMASIYQAKTEIDLTAFVPDWTYTGTAFPDPDESVVRVSGAAYADLVFTWYSGSVDEANKLTGTPVDAGTYYVTATIPESQNLGFSTATSAPITVKPMPITVTADSNSKIYGEADPELTWSADPQPFDSLQGISVSRAAGEDVGSYEIVVTVDADRNPNYAITPVNGSFTIQPKSLHSADITISGIEKSYAYTGSAIQPEITVMDGDTVLVEGTDYTVAYGDNTNVYDNNAVTVTGMGNYADDLDKHFEITSILPTYTAPTGLTATYGQTLSEIDLSAFGNEYGQWQWDDPTTPVQVEDQGYPATFVPYSGNYQNVPVTLPVTVSPKTVSFGGCIVWDKEYDGTTAAYVTDIVFDGLVPGDTLDHTYTAVFDDANTGDRKPVTLTITLKDPNYTMPENVIENFGRIYAREVMPDIALSQTSFVYNGKPQMPALTLKDDFGNVIPESEYSVSNSGNVNVGTAIASITDNAGGNYAVTECAATFTITPAPLTIAAESKAIYVGENLPVLTYKVTGLYGSDILLKEPTLSTTADVNRTGSYAINITGAVASGNYTITYMAGELRVDPLPVSTEPETQKKPVSRQEEEPKPITVPISNEEKATVHVQAEVKAHEATIKDFEVEKLDQVVGDHAEEIGTVTVDFSELKQNIETVNIPTAAIAYIAEAAADAGNDTEKLEIILDKDISIEFDAIALNHKIEQADDKNITITVQPENRAKDVTKAQKKAFGNRPAYQVSVYSGDEHIAEIDGEVTVSVAYELKKGETAEGLKVYAVDEKGEKILCEAEYDPETGRIRWKTNKHSFYVIAYEEPTGKIPE